MTNEIEVFNRKTNWDRQGKPSILNLDLGGRITFSAEAKRRLGLKVGDKISFAIHKKDPGIVYYYEDTDGLPLKNNSVNNSHDRLTIYSRPLTAKLLAHLGCSTNKSFPVNTKTVNFYGKTAWFIQKDDLYRNTNKSN